MSFAIVLIPLTHKPVQLEREREREVTKTPKGSNEIMQLKKIIWKKKKVIRVLYLGIFLHFFFIYQDLLIFFDLVLFWVEWLIFGISGSPIGISLIRLSKLLDRTEVNPSKYVEPNTFEHKPCSWAPYKHMQLLATKRPFLLLLLLLWIFLAFSSCRREVL